MKWNKPFENNMLKDKYYLWCDQKAAHRDYKYFVAKVFVDNAGFEKNYELVGFGDRILIDLDKHFLWCEINGPENA